jgi:hypothetical protein
MKMNVSVASGKYNVIMEDGGKLHALRYGEPWRDCVGDNLIYFLAAELEEARKEIIELNKTINALYS